MKILINKSREYPRAATAVLEAQPKCRIENEDLADTLKIATLLHQEPLYHYYHLSLSRLFKDVFLYLHTRIGPPSAALHPKLVHVTV